MSYVDKTVIGAIQVPTPPVGITDGDFVPSFGVSPDSPWSLVSDRFNQSMETAETLLEKLIGGGTESGYLNDLQDIIADFATGIADDIIYNNVTIGDDATTIVPSAPVFGGGLETDFGTFDAIAPVLTTIPSVDLSALLEGSMPDEISSAITWFEETYDDSLYTALYDRLITDLQVGASGIGGTVEQEIYDRALARQAIEEDKLQTEIEEYFSSTGFDLPTGAMVARLQEHANGRAMRELDLNSQIIIEQAELAQKNSQFIIEAAKGLEAVLRDYASKKNDRSLDYAKAVAANAISIYAENVRGYLATLEANKTYVQLQVENLKAVIESNRGAVEVYAAEASAFEISVNAKANKNKAITDVYKAEVDGYSSETSAVAENQKNILQAYALKIQDADNELKGAIASAEASIKGYGTEYSLREKVAEALANVAMQAMASAYGAVNSSAGLSYSGSENVSQSWGHSESRSESFTHSESLSANVSTSLNNTLSETHSYEET